MSGPTVLVYTPDRGEAEECARLAGPGVRWAWSAESARPYLDKLEVLCCWGFPGELWPRLPRLRWVHKMGAGVEDVLAHLDPGGPVRLTRTVGVFGPRMAEFVLAHTLAFLQDLPRVYRQQRERRWERYIPRRAAGVTLGVAGTGDVGQTVARAAAAVGMRVVGWRRTPAPIAGFERVWAGEGELAAFLAACQVLVLALPRTPATDGLMDGRRLAALPAGALLINVGRGGAVKLDDLAAALRSGHLGGAVLDVLPEEPPPADAPVWELPGCVVTPHVSGPNVPAEVMRSFQENLRRYLAGEPLLHAVDLRRGY